MAKIGRNKKVCERYKLQGRRETNKAKKQERPKSVKNILRSGARKERHIHINRFLIKKERMNIGEKSIREHIKMSITELNTRGLKVLQQK